MSLLNLRTQEYEQSNNDFLKLFPILKVKFRDQLCLTGHKYNFIELSKVDITKDFNMTPTIFNTNKENTHTLDCIGIYSVGIMEILYMTLIKDPSMLTTAIANLYKVFNIFDDYKDVSKTLNQLDIYDSSKISIDEQKAFNLAFTMKTDYNREGYNMIKEYMNIMMIIWLRDKSLYWQIFFEIMDFCMPIMSILLEDPIWEEFKKNHDDVALRAVSKNDWLYKDDLHLQKIGYSIPNSDTNRYISDCRGIAIWLTTKFYLQFLSKFGEMTSKTEPFFDYTNLLYIDYIDNKLKDCIGNDSMSLALSDKYLDENAKFGLNGSMIYHADKINSNKVIRILFEDAVLFCKAYHYDLNTFDIANISKNDLCMHYFCLDSLTHAIGSILYYSKELYGNATKKLESKIENLDNENARLLNENSLLRKKISEISNDNKVANIEEVQALQLELDKINELLESKQTIIDKLVQKNKELTLYIDNIYNEDDINDSDIEEDISIEEMVQYINDFSFTLIGGRMELIQKLTDIGWTNVTQFDHRNKNRLSGNIPLSDFYVINTKFISHSLVEKVESIDNIAETLIYYNGTNIDKLVLACYKFLKKYFN